MNPILEARHLAKSYPGVRAVADVSLAFLPGEIHGLVGENGAGKSTLLKLIAGLLPPDAGEILIDGRVVRLRHLHDSLGQGIHLVSQEIQLVPESSIAENVMLDKLPVRGWGGRIDWRAAHLEARRCAGMVGLDLPSGTPVRELSAARKKLVQIARALGGQARLLLLDEPTAALTRHETQMLTGVLRRLKERGVTIVYISHHLEEVLDLCDRVSVLRDGRLIGTRVAAAVTKPELVQMMVGRECREERFSTLNTEGGREMLRAERLCRRGKVRDVSFALNAGEILGFYGLVGAGRTETARLVIGSDRLDSGRVFIRGRALTPHGARDSLRRHGLGYVSENRKEEGLHLEASVRANITITIWHQLRHWLSRGINRREENRVAADLVGRLDVKCAGLSQPVKNLSGGNQQKVCLAKWLAARCEILIIDEPTVGVDVGAKEQIHRLIWDLAAKERKAILLISSDMREIIRLASRILVFKDQRVVGEVTGVPDRGFDEVARKLGGLLA